MLDEKRYGEYFAGGGKRDPEGSALSGKPVSSGDIHVSVGPHHFVVVRAVEKRALSSADWQAVKAAWKAQFADASPASDTDIITRDLPDFETMTVAELKDYATTHQLDVSGQRTQTQLAQTIRAALVMQQFDAPAPSDTQPVAVSTGAEGSA